MFFVDYAILSIRIYLHMLCSRLVAPLFSKVSAALTSSASEADIRTLFENFVKEVHSIRSKKSNMDRK